MNVSELIASLSDIKVSREGVDYFTNKLGGKKADDITIESLQPPKHEFNEEDNYTIEGRSGRNKFGPVQAKYVKTAKGREYIFIKQSML